MTHFLDSPQPPGPLQLRCTADVASEPNKSFIYNKIRLITDPNQPKEPNEKQGLDWLRSVIPRTSLPTARPSAPPATPPPTHPRSGVIYT